MNVTSGMTVKDDRGDIHKFGVSLDWNDFLRLVDEGKVPGWKLDTRPQLGAEDVAPELRPPQRVVVVNEDGAEIGLTTAWDILRRWGNRLILVQMAADEVVSGEYAASEIRKLFPGVPV